MLHPTVTHLACEAATVGNDIELIYTVCRYIKMCVCTYVYTYMYVRMYVCMYACVYVYMHVCVYMYVCMYVCLQALWSRYLSIGYVT